MEWLFFVSKQSILTALEWDQALLAFFIVPTFLAAPLLICYLPTYILEKRTAQIMSFNKAALTLLSAFLMSCLTLILVDNFTYTVWGYGIITTPSDKRYFYTAGFCAVFIYRIWSFRKKEKSSQKIVGSYVKPIAFLYIIGVVAVVGKYSLVSFESPQNQPSTNHSKAYPNIILLGIDGLSANHLSAYGYDRATTPFMSAMRDKVLFVENAFTNHSKTFASLTAMLTGRLPTETGVTAEPRILLNEDAYLHLPAILRNLGYYTIQESMRFWADAEDLNIQDGFDFANGRPLHEKNLISISPEIHFKFMYETMYFTRVLERIWHRLLHIFGIETMEHHFAHVTPGTLKKYGMDHSRISNMFKKIEQSTQPFMVHLHLLDTHCCNYKRRFGYFSNDMEPILDDTDQYDDAILAADQDVGKIYKWLEEKGYLENTVIVINSDHGRRGSAFDRIPLMIKFPQNKHVAHTNKIVQAVDIAPTILEYIGVAKPRWMSGQSFLTEASREKIPSKRPIYSIHSSEKDKSDAPFHISKFGMMLCGKWHLFDKNFDSPEIFDLNLKLDEGCINVETDPTEATKLVRAHLSSKGIR
jgi:glucan phosphoethanolaminetransferase (alkaline phosphatase superfamily)